MFGAGAFVEVLDGIVLFVVKFAFVLVKTDVRIRVLILFVKSVAEKLDGVETVGIYGVGSNLVDVFVDISLDVRPYVSLGVNRNPLFSAVNPNVNVSSSAGGCAEGAVLDVSIVFVFIRSNNDEVLVEGDVAVYAFLEEDCAAVYVELDAVAVISGCGNKGLEVVLVVELIPVNIVNNIALTCEVCVFVVVSNELPSVDSGNLVAGAEGDGVGGLLDVGYGSLNSFDNLSSLDVVSIFIEVTENEVFVLDLFAFDNGFVDVNGLAVGGVAFRIEGVGIVVIYKVEAVRHIVDVVIETVTVYVVNIGFVETAGVNLLEDIYEGFRVGNAVIVNFIVYSVGNEHVFVNEIEGVFVIVEIADGLSGDELEVVSISCGVLLSVGRACSVGRLSVGVRSVVEICFLAIDDSFTGETLCVVVVVAVVAVLSVGSEGFELDVANRLLSHEGFSIEDFVDVVVVIESYEHVEVTHDVVVSCAFKCEILNVSVELSRSILGFGILDVNLVEEDCFVAEVAGGFTLCAESVFRSSNYFVFNFENVVDLFSERRITGIGFENPSRVFVVADLFGVLRGFRNTGLCEECVVEKNCYIASGKSVGIGNLGVETFVKSNAFAFRNFNVAERIGKGFFLFVAESADDHGVSILKGDGTFRFKGGSRGTLDDTLGIGPRDHEEEGRIFKVGETGCVGAALNRVTFLHEAVNECRHLFAGYEFVGTESGFRSTLSHADVIEKIYRLCEIFVVLVNVGKLCSGSAESEHAGDHYHCECERKKFFEISHFLVLLLKFFCSPKRRVLFTILSYSTSHVFASSSFKV